MTLGINQTTNFNELVRSLSPKLVKELMELDKYSIENKESVAKMARRLLAECDDLEEDLCVSVDYLQCQIEHENNQTKALNFLTHQQRFESETYELRHEFSRLREKLMEDLRYGKRTEELDKVLTHLSTLTMLANQMPTAQPIVNFAGIEQVLSPRCMTCTDTCRSAFRKVQVFLRKLIKACEADACVTTT